MNRRLGRLQSIEQHVERLITGSPSFYLFSQLDEQALSQRPVSLSFGRVLLTDRQIYFKIN